MENNNVKVIGLWFAINKKGDLLTFVNEPTRDKDRGTWVGEYFVNSVIYNQIKQLIDKANINWQHEPEYIEFQMKLAN